MKGVIADETANLLVVHDRISGLERVRDDLLRLMSATKESGAKIAVKRTAVETYFMGVEVVAAQLEQRLMQELCEPLELVKTNPKRFVTCIRIIEREETLDAAAAAEVGFTNTHRPKHLRKKLLERLSQLVEMRFVCAGVLRVFLKKN